MLDDLHLYMFLGDHVSAADSAAIIVRMSAATTARAAAISGGRIAAVNAWDCSKSGDKVQSQGK